MIYAYIRYWNKFKYKYITQIIFYVVKQCDARVTSEDVCVLYIITFLYLFLFCLGFVFFHEALHLLYCLSDFVYSYM